MAERLPSQNHLTLALKFTLCPLLENTAFKEKEGTEKEVTLTDDFQTQS